MRVPFCMLFLLGGFLYTGTWHEGTMYPAGIVLVNLYLTGILAICYTWTQH